MRGRAGLGDKLTVAFLTVGLVVGCVYLMRPLWWYATGTATKAVVERCVDPGRRPLTCSGHWTLPGGDNGRGEIAGAGNGDVGKTVGVRATTSHAAKLTIRLFYGPLLMLVVGAVLTHITYRQRAGGREARPPEHQR